MDMNHGHSLFYHTFLYARKRNESAPIVPGLPVQRFASEPNFEIF